ncbi:hypothetical protein D4764_04G0010430 [Takifugu flavidus]|uniref:Uncharacterized protein n=1 Tax=Takifugu flavidus TaxID=433684 RepID=A0A5C6N521_9TELE|nr:hypothetical protein D4764_04G0010430 [Takifugu flavidus]
MEGNPDLPGSTADVWERHLSHHINKFKVKQEGKKEEVVTAQEQLLKMQLDEALKKLNDKHKEEKQMVQRFPRQVQPDLLGPHQDFALINPYWVSPRGGMCGRRGGQGYGLIGGYLGRDQCHACKGYGHWQRDYPEVLRGLAPSYLEELVIPYQPNRPLRSQNAGLLVVPRVSRSRMGGRAFSYQAPLLWNQLPVQVSPPSELHDDLRPR